MAGAPARLEHLAKTNHLYLGRRGQWAGAEYAVTFDSEQAAQAALQDKWSELHNAGNRDVILSVVVL